MKKEKIESKMNIFMKVELKMIQIKSMKLGRVKTLSKDLNQILELNKLNKFMNQIVISNKDYKKI